MRSWASELGRGWYAGTHQPITAIKSTFARKAHHLAYGFSCKSAVCFWLARQRIRFLPCFSQVTQPGHLMGDPQKGSGFQRSFFPGPWAGAEASAGPAASAAWLSGSGPRDWLRSTPAGWGCARPSMPDRACVQTAHPLWKGGSLNVAQIIAGTQANCRLLLAHKLSGTFEIDPHYPKRHP